MTTSQDLDKAAPPFRRWPRFRRRASPVPAPLPGDDAWAFYAANRRIVQLESQNAVLQNRVDRYAGQCAPPCWHEQQLDAARLENLRLEAQHADIHAHIRDVLDKVRAANDTHGPAAGPELPR